MVCVVFATEEEAAPFKGMSHDAEVAVTGVGQVNVTRTLTALYESGYDGPVILGGCAGAYPGSGLKVGDVAVATEEIFADAGVQTPDGWLELSGMGMTFLETGGKSYAERMPIPAACRALACLGGVMAAGGPFATVSAVSGTMERGERLQLRYGVICENMEGAAAAQVALYYGRPFIEVRGVSNMVVDRDRDTWDIPLASANCARAISELVRRSAEWS